MKKGLKIGTALLSGLMVLSSVGCSCGKDPEDPVVALPTARIDTCAANDYSLACSSITAENFDDYAERDDVLYYDLRNYEEYANLENGHMRGFEFVEFNKFFYGDTDQLFIKSNGSDKFMPRYEESVSILESVFPKDKTIFLMCAGGGRVVNLMKIMELNGYDMNKVYNVGGYSQFKAANSKYLVENFNVADLTEKTTATPTAYKTLPEARKDTCEDNDYSLACSSVTAENFNDYAERNDVLYYDLRNYEEYANLENGHVQGFEFIEFNKFFYGDTDQLFIKSNGSDKFMPRYEESVSILESVFPKDKTIFLMCAGGGRVVNLMKIMELNGYDMSKVYNVGGYSQFKAANSKYLVENFDVNDLTELDLREGTFTQTSFGHEYITKVYVALDANNKISHLYVSGESSDSETWPENSKWYDNKDEFVSGLIGKTLEEIEAKLTGANQTASGNDVVTGATLSSNRVYKAILDAYNG